MAFSSLEQEMAFSFSALTHNKYDLDAAANCHFLNAKLMKYI